jgi:hypothetical protein
MFCIHLLHDIHALKIIWYWNNFYAWIIWYPCDFHIRWWLGHFTMTRWVLLVGHELLTLREHLNSPTFLVELVLLDLYSIVDHYLSFWFIFLLPIVLSVLFRLTASDYPFTKFRLFYSIKINRNFPLNKLFKLDANIIIISFNVFLISLYYKNKANNKMPLPTCDKWHKGKQILKCHYIHHTRDTWHQVCFSSITARHLQVYIMNTADVLQETVNAYPSRAPVVIVAPLFYHSLICILTFIPLLQRCACLSLSPGRVKQKTIKLIFVAYPLNTQHLVVIVNTTARFGISRMCPSGMTCLSADDCFSVVAL